MNFAAKCPIVSGRLFRSRFIAVVTQLSSVSCVANYTGLVFNWIGRMGPLRKEFCLAIGCVAEDIRRPHWPRMGLRPPKLPENDHSGIQQFPDGNNRSVNCDTLSQNDKYRAGQLAIQSIFTLISRCSYRSHLYVPSITSLSLCQPFVTVFPSII